MRKAILALVFLSGCLLTAGTLATFGLLSSKNYFYLFAFLLSLLAILVFVVLVFRMYRRLENRTRQASTILSEMKFMQERRYEQLAGRLDALRESQHPTDAPGQQSILAEPSALEDVNARLQRFERRILGQLENESLNADKQSRQLELLLAFLIDDSNDENEKRS